MFNHLTHCVTEVIRTYDQEQANSVYEELMELMYRQEGQLDSVSSYVEDTGEVNWLVDDALHMEVPVPVNSQAVMQLFASRDDRKNWARAIAMMLSRGQRDRKFRTCGALSANS